MTAAHESLKPFQSGADTSAMTATTTTPEITTGTYVIVTRGLNKGRTGSVTKVIPGRWKLPTNYSVSFGKGLNLRCTAGDFDVIEATPDGAPKADAVKAAVKRGAFLGALGGIIGAS